MGKSTRRFTYIGGNSRKFWEVDEPQQVDDNSWVVNVQFGRIGTWGQDHTNVFSTKYEARTHYLHKIQEKERKGYKEEGAVSVKKNVANYHPAGTWQDTLTPAKPKPVCEHNVLTRTGQKFKCTACQNVVEFEKAQLPAGDGIEIVTKVRRFFNVSGRS